LLALAISVYILWRIKQIVLLVFAAVVLATVLNNVVRQLQRYRIKRGIAIAITIVMLLAIIVGFFAAIAPRLVEQLQQLVNLLPQVSQRLREWFLWAQSVIPGPMLEQFQGFENLAQQLQTLITRLLGNFLVLLNNSLGVVINLLLFFVLTMDYEARSRSAARVYDLSRGSFRKFIRIFGVVSSDSATDRFANLD
jgi:predicted PurR-regulated permease PerM